MHSESLVPNLMILNVQQDVQVYIKSCCEHMHLENRHKIIIIHLKNEIDKKNLLFMRKAEKLRSSFLFYQTNYFEQKILKKSKNLEYFRN